MEETSLQILIAEDSLADRMILESIVEQAGHHAIVVDDGYAALEAFSKHLPDIVLLDVVMPKYSGIEVARKIRADYKDDLVPIIFLTSLTDNDSLVDCIESGGNDFISKPYNQVVLASKIKSFARLREMHQTVSEQKRQIEIHNQHLIQEQTVAKQVFDKVAHAGSLDDGYMRYYMSPLAVFNGDVIVADISPTGSLIVLLGDFTGHGLPAAIGSMPLATTFYGMVRKGFSISDIVREINQKLHEILPVGFFCCAMCIDISPQQRRLRYWNGGLPASLMYKAEKDEYEILESNNLPLGVMPTKNFNAKTERISLQSGDRILMWSDGIFEARNSHGEMYGEERLHALLQKDKGSDELFSHILSAVHEHVGTSEKDDDISLVEIPYLEKPYESKYHKESNTANAKLVDWSMTLDLPFSTLSQFDPLPLVTNILNDVTGLRPHQTVLYTVIAELYSNALEHGILRLDSSMKKTPQGFVAYYDLRREALNALTDGNITFRFDHKQSQDDKGMFGLLSIRIIDSGHGFGVEEDCFIEPKDDQDLTQSQHRYFGRGLTLMGSVCESIHLRAPGNDVEVVFKWHELDK